MRLAVVGGRTFSDRTLCEFVLDEFCSVSETPVVIISGGAKGADNEAARYAFNNGLELIGHHADWSIGKQAGYLRNITIVDDCDELVAFWDGKSKGTLHSINLAKKQGKTVTVIRYDQTCMEYS